MKTLMEAAKAARAAAAEVAQLSTEEKNAALLAMADALEANMGSILAANAADMERERANGMSSDLLDRLAPVSYTHLPARGRWPGRGGWSGCSRPFRWRLSSGA